MQRLSSRSLGLGGALRDRIGAALGAKPSRNPRRYWQRRARGLIEMYDHPERWASRGWLRPGVEEHLVPTLLRKYGCHSVLVAGAGSGRQYEFLQEFDVRGFDISSRLVSECRTRYPSVPTEVADICGCEYIGRFDATITSALLAHVPPERIEQAARSLLAAAQRLVVLREWTALDAEYDHQWAHDYECLFRSWDLVYREVTDSRANEKAELLAFTNPALPSGESSA